MVVVSTAKYTRLQHIRPKAPLFLVIWNLQNHLCIKENRLKSALELYIDIIVVNLWDQSPFAQDIG